MNLTHSQIKVSGNIISELSEKIPTNIIALNELIKNAYDAGAPMVRIVLNSESKTLEIIDNGVGMDKDDIERLFHISSSEKKYGEEITVNGYKRLTQGSKGLGFLSVFKFGDKVRWVTTKYENLEFSIVFSDLLKKDDITKYSLPIKHSPKKNDNGTRIIIEMNDYSLRSLVEYLSKKVNLNKILNSFIDKNFLIHLNIDGEKYSTDTSLDLDKEYKEKQLLRVRYNDADEKIVFYYKNRMVHEVGYAFDGQQRYFLNIDIQIYDLTGGRRININPLFHKSSEGQLTPLLYVNNNLFNNYSIFNPEVMKAVKYERVLPQMIGYICIKSSDKEISFNSDRTQFSQNNLTDRIVNFLESINKKIQEIGSQLKRELNFNYNFLTSNKICEENITKDFKEESLLIKGFLLKKLVAHSVTEQEITYTLFDNKRIVRIIPKEKKRIEKIIELKLGNKPKSDLKSIYNSNNIVTLNGNTELGFNENVPGIWKVTEESDSEIKEYVIKIVNPQKPKVEQLITDLNIHQAYKYDELFLIKNSFGEKDKGVKPELQNDGGADIEDKNMEITFSTVREAKLVVKVIDKKTQLEYLGEFYFRVINPSKKILDTSEGSSDFIEMAVSSSVYFSSSIAEYINELNLLCKEVNYNYTFVSSVRTLVELIVNDILDKKEIEKQESLAENYRTVYSLYSEFIQEIANAKDKQVITNIFRTINTQRDRDGFIAFLNLSTHGSARIITKKQVELKSTEIRLLLEFLNYLSKD
ncbi:Histidine kinase-, DNA gyrase B-, and HSP90-like ATPase [Amphibacillus marinus]|uniref:Histidine kinase-, DNA gyrase B-, and HSP90-like ATPase n=1 Tax=Amphibacillus marinus TaxID=872970 RepID=A0A1H8T966_9BACI|nr:ATP-binding protein [Amphibacillus marinus]SEO87355.1 Histidine kinase-, DNA gyrase B-, and HSP90-like ATPase [Amphibacillus marinus]